MSAIETYANIIEGEGLIVGRFPDDARRLWFRYEGDRYQLFTYDDDSDFVGISATYSIPKGISRAVALRETNEFSRKMKVVKATIDADRGVVIGAETFVSEPEVLRPIFLRLVSNIDYTSGNLYRRFREIVEASGKTPATVAL